MTDRLVVQLFNTTGARARLTNAEEPQHRRWESVLEAEGFRLETMPVSARLWGRLTRRHNAYLGLDPLRALRVLIGRRDAALVCAHMESAVALLLLRRLFRFRPPIVIWEVPWSPGWKFRDIVSRLAIRRAECSVVFGSNQIELVHRRYGEAVPTVFVPFCVDTEFFRPRPTRAGTQPYILSCGLDAGRDFGIVLEASRGIAAPFVIKARGLPAHDPARFPNVTMRSEHLSFPDYRDMYAGASVVVVATSDTPNASGVTSLLEAMAMGKPTIVSDNPALRDYLPPPDAGIVIPIGDEAALRAAIEDLLRHPERARAMGVRGRAFVERRFSPEAHYRATAKLFHGLICGARSAHPSAGEGSCPSSA